MTTETLTKVPDIYEDEVLRYVLHGWMHETPAKQLCELPSGARMDLVEAISGLAEQDLEEGQAKRAEWVTHILGREDVEPGVRSVFVHTVKTRPEVNRRQGLSTRAFTSGRHSSGDTSGW